MFSDLKVKTEGTSRSTACTISRNEKEIVSNENTDSDTISSVYAKKIFDDDLPEINRFVENSKPISFTKNWYSKPTPPDMQFEKRAFQIQFSISADKLYEWNIDGLSGKKKKSSIRWVICLWLVLLIKIIMILINLKLLVYLLLDRKSVV